MFETPAQTAIARAVHGDGLTTSDWERLALYMAAQDVRTPLNYIESVNQWHSILPDVLQHTLEELAGELEEAKRTGRRLNMRQSAERLPFADTLKVQIDPHARPETHEAEIKVTMVAGRSLWLKGQRHLLEHTAKVLVSHR